MMPYFHTNGGDILLFESWAPTSPGAIGGASVAIFFLAMLERLVNGLRGRFAGYWASNALHRSIEHTVHPNNGLDHKVKIPPSSSWAVARRKRFVPPFILAHDLPRGFTYMFQATIAYALMLIAMTFNVAYFVSIIMGLCVGEAIFGRWAYSPL